MNLKHQTEAEFLARLREKFASSERQETIDIAAWVMDRIDDGTFTDAKIRTMFSLTAPQWAALKTRLRNYQTSKNTIKNAKGE